MKHDLTDFHPIISANTSLDSLERPDLTQVRGSVTFTDQSVLHIRENYVIVTGWIDYSYHWQTADNQLIHRWDNAHPVPFSTSPFHWNASPATHRFRRECAAVRADDTGSSADHYRPAAGIRKLIDWLSFWLSLKKQSWI